MSKMHYDNTTLREKMVVFYCPSLLPVVGLVVIFLLFNFLTGFRMMGNMALAFSSVYVTMIPAMGVFFIMTMGGLDFSQGSILGISSIVVCVVSKYSIPLAILAGIASGAIIGAINGYFYVFRKIKSFIVTICTMFLFRGFIKYLTTNAPVAGSAKLINYDTTAFKVICTIVILVIGFVAFRFTKFGTYLKAIGAGGNQLETQILIALVLGVCLSPVEQRFVSKISSSDHSCTLYSTVD